MIMFFFADRIKTDDPGMLWYLFGAELILIDTPVLGLLILAVRWKLGI